MVSNLTVKVGADIAGLQKELQKATGQLNGFSKGMNAIGTAMAGAFAVGSLVSLGKGILDVTSEFQKFEAVLTNTLGSKSAAKFALDQIQQFAAKTPFQVNELTGAFVKLANQGFAPTMQEMTSLGDLASAMGKSFDQLAEAIIDAQTGEFERLKEFGIRAQKQGDKVTFTFKGVKKQVDFTAGSIREYILSLGQAEGVSGGMAMQSETLGGKISNLKDSFDQLLLAFGQLITKGGFVIKSLEVIARTMQMAAGTFQGDKKQGIEAAIRKMKELQAETKRGSKEWILYNDEILALEGALRSVTEQEKKLADQTKNTNDKVVEQTINVRALVDEWDRANSIFAKKFNPTDGIKSKDLGSFEYESGAMQYMANASSRALEYLNNNLKVNGNAVAVWQGQVSARAKMAAESIEMDLGAGISGVFTDLASALGRASVGMEDFGKAIMKSIGGFMQQFGGALIALGIGKIALTKFSGPAMIAAGAVLTAAGAAVQASAEKAAQTAGSGSGSSSSVSSGSSFRSRADSAIQDSNPQLVTVLKGEDMWIMLQNYQANNRLTHG